MKKDWQHHNNNPKEQSRYFVTWKDPSNPKAKTMVVDILFRVNTAANHEPYFGKRNRGEKGFDGAAKMRWVENRQALEKKYIPYPVKAGTKGPTVWKSQATEEIRPRRQDIYEIALIHHADLMRQKEALQTKA